MNTPVCDFVKSYSASEPVRLHMPGHKGAGLVGVEHLDITEIPGADVLYHESGILQESQQNASHLFGTQKTLYSAEGSSLPIRAMLCLVSLYARERGRKPVIAAGRNAHKVFITAAALLDLEVQWLYSEEAGNLIRCNIDADALDAFLSECREKPAAVYITSPDYLGNVADIANISRVCQKYGCLLLVDNAHGAYLQFLSPSRHPMALGADLCCDSAHKTLPVLTGGAYLHISRSAPLALAEQAERAMALFASTSPSYLILQSLDRANAYLADGFSEKLENASEVWAEFKGKLESLDYPLVGSEPLKLTVMPKKRGCTGEKLAEHLRKQNIFCEFSDPDHLVLMLPVTFAPELPERLLAAFRSIPAGAAVKEKPPVLPKGIQVIPPREALLLPSEQIDAKDASGRIMAAPCVSCPPAIPIVSIGERIEPAAVEAMAYYGIEKIRVLKG